MDELLEELKSSLKPHRPRKIHALFAPLFIGLWILLYVLIVPSRVNYLPEAVNNEDEANLPGRFVSERAWNNLEALSAFGPRVTGSYANEVSAVRFLLQRISEIRGKQDFSSVEFDVQTASGSYVHGDMLNTYRSIQNVVVKLSWKNSTSPHCLLINAHFDSAAQSSGAGDNGAMVVVAMEVLKVLAASNTPLRHSIVFLFNGAKESPLQGGHAFLTQHKWAKCVKSVINLDARGSGGKEVLVPPAPHHPWVIEKYADNVRHPCGSIFSEELMAGETFVDSDFSTFRRFGNWSGLSFVYYQNGYHYHTRYDTIHNIPKESLQNTGDNILAVSRAIANAQELSGSRDAENHKVVFFDILGYSTVFYTEANGKYINLSVAVIALVTIAVSLSNIAEKAGVSFSAMSRTMLLVQMLQAMSLGLAVGLSLGLAWLMGYLNLTMAWYYHQWMAVCLYGCPVVFGLAILPAAYLQFYKEDAITPSQKALMFTHAQCNLLIIAMLTLTFQNVRSAYLPMITILFYDGSLIVNFLTTLHDRKSYWILPAIVFQIPPFIYHTYLATIHLQFVIPAAGTAGLNSNPELGVAKLVVLFSVLSLGLIVPVLLLFRKSKTILFAFLAFSALVVFLAFTPVGHPFKEKLAPQRFSIVHSKRVFYGADGRVRRDEPVFHILPADRKALSTLGEISQKAPSFPILKVKDECAKEMTCGFGYYDERWFAQRETSLYIRAQTNPTLTPTPQLKLLQSTGNRALSVKKYTFQLIGTDHMSVLIQPTSSSKLIRWNFNRTMLETTRNLPYFVYLASGSDNKPHTIELEFEKERSNFTSPTFEIGVSVHWAHQTQQKTTEFDALVRRFPWWATVQTWAASYVSYVY